MKFGTLDFVPVSEATALVAEPIGDSISKLGLQGVYVAEIDPSLADTSAFCENYQIGLEVSANCVVVEARRADRKWHGACVVLATTRADVNGAVRKTLGASKISFAPMDTAVTATGMEYGGISPIGLPGQWPILVDVAVANTASVIVGSGIRSSKLLIPGSLLSSLPGAMVMDIVKPT